MSWTRTEIKRSYPCNPEIFKYLRERKKWSQRQLAKEAGYCERLICKAETGGSISSHTIAVLAQTLSSEDMKIYPEDLISDPVALAKKFVHAAFTSQRGSLDTFWHFVASDADLSFWESAKEPGEHRRPGTAILDEIIERHFQRHEIIAPRDHAASFKYYADGNVVIVWGELNLRDRATGNAEVENITLRLCFEKGKLIKIDDRSSFPHRFRKPV